MKIIGRREWIWQENLKEKIINFVIWSDKNNFYILRNLRETWDNKCLQAIVENEKLR